MKNKKLWFWIGLSLFVIPEVLWGRVVFILRSLFTSCNVCEPTWSLLSSANFTDNWVTFLIFLEALGLILSIIFAPGGRRTSLMLRTLLLIILLVTLLVGVASIQLRSIGF